jgi:hypothetical protein
MPSHFGARVDSSCYQNLFETRHMLLCLLQVFFEPRRKLFVTSGFNHFRQRLIICFSALYRSLSS